MTNTAAVTYPYISVFPPSMGRWFIRPVYVIHSEDRSEKIGHVHIDLDGWNEDGSGYYSYVPYFHGDQLRRETTLELAVQNLERAYEADLQEVTFTVTMKVSRSSWDLAYGDHDGDADRAEDVRSYVSGMIANSSQGGVDGEGGIVDVEVDHR